MATIPHVERKETKENSCYLCKKRLEKVEERSTVGNSFALARERTGGGGRKPLLRAQAFPRDAPVLPHPQTLPEGMRLEGSELNGLVPAQPLQPTFSSRAYGSLKGIKLLPYLFSHQINDSEIPNSKAGLPRVLCPNGTNPPSLRCTDIQANFSSLPLSLLLALEKPQKLCFNPSPAAFPEPPQSHTTFSSHVEMPQTKPLGSGR